MITLLMKYLAKLPLHYPKAVVIASLVLTILAAVFIPRLHVSTDRNLLSGTDNEEFRRREEVNKLFGTSLVAVVILSGHSEKNVRKTADELALALKKHPEFIRDVFHKIDIGFLESHALMFAPNQVVEKIVTGINKNNLTLDALAEITDLPSLVEAGATALEDSPIPEDANPKDIENGLALFDEVLGSINTWFLTPSTDTIGLVELLWKDGAAFFGKARSEGYLTENDGKPPHLSVLFVQPTNTSQDMDFVVPFTKLLREKSQVIAKKNGNIESLVTGMPPLQADELQLVSRDCVVAGIAAGLGVVLIFLLAFRSLRVTLFVVLPLSVGLIWSAGFTGAFYGHLTLITSYFAAVLFGLGVAFTIHIVARFHEALRNGETKENALAVALTRSGPGVVVGGVTTAVAFFVIVFSEFQGFAEMGVISGAGVMMILVANLTLLPAALLLWHPGLKAVVITEPKQAIWIGIAKSRVIVPTICLLGIIIGIFVTNRVDFDYAVESMLPSNSQAVEGIKLLDKRTDFSSTYSVAVTSSIKKAEALRQRFEALPTVSKAEAISMLVPNGQPQKVALLAKVTPDKKQLVDQLVTQFTKQVVQPSKTTAESLAESLQGLADTLQDLSFDAKRANRKEANQLVALSQKAAKVSKMVLSTNDDERAQALEKSIFSLFRRGLAVLSKGLDDKGFTIKELPQTIKGRFVSQDNQHFAVIAYPNGDIGNKTFFYRHVNELLSVDSKTTGHPVTHRRFTEMVHNGFTQAVVLAALAVILLVLLDLRTFKGLALALIPLLAAGGWAALISYLFDFKMNYANLMGLPIIIGTGVDYGVHLAHRAKQEGSVLKAAATTGRAIALSGATTLVGFGSLLLGNHWGVRSLGILLVMGIFFSLITALVVLPGLLSKKNEQNQNTAYLKGA